MFNETDEKLHLMTEKVEKVNSYFPETFWIADTRNYTFCVERMTGIVPKGPKGPMAVQTGFAVSRKERKGNKEKEYIYILLLSAKTNKDSPKKFNKIVNKIIPNRIDREEMDVFHLLSLAEEKMRTISSEIAKIIS